MTTEEYTITRKPDTDKAWNALHARLKEENLLSEIKEEYPVRRMVIPVRWVAAVLFALCIGTAIIVHFYPSSDTNHLLTLQNIDNNNTLVKTLDDGSTIYLAGNASLSYPKTFAQHDREVTLKGNALFDIARNPDKPFRIETEKMIVEVLGTSFKVKSDVKGAFELAVLRGKVKVMQKENKEYVYVTAGQCVTLIGSHLRKSYNPEASSSDGFTENMRFKDEPLERIIRVINQNSAQTVVLKDELIKQYKLNVRFYNKNVDSMTRLISLALHLKREVKQDSIFISQP
jgi:Fe2+-dicitrate sensor, membrane component